MDTDNRLRFGKYVESLRKSKGKSLRATAEYSVRLVQPFRFFSAVFPETQCTFSINQCNPL